MERTDILPHNAKAIKILSNWELDTIIPNEGENFLNEIPSKPQPNVNNQIITNNKNQKLRAKMSGGKLPFYFPRYWAVPGGASAHPNDLQNIKNQIKLMVTDKCANYTANLPPRIISMTGGTKYRKKHKKRNTKQRKQRKTKQPKKYKTKQRKQPKKLYTTKHKKQYKKRSKSLKR